MIIINVSIGWLIYFGGLKIGFWVSVNDENKAGEGG